MNWKRYLPFFFTLLLLALSLAAEAQCAMCTATAQQSSYGKSLNRGIEYLLLAPVFILGSVALIWIRNRDKFAGKQ